MNQRKPHILSRYWIWLVALCLCACMVLGVGVSYARYRTDFLTESYKFSAGAAENILMHGEVTEELTSAVLQGQWPEVPAGWTQLEQSQTEGTQPEAELKFSVSNGESGANYAKRDQAVSIQLVAGLTIEAPEKLTVTMTAPGAEENSETMRYTAVPEPILEGSFLYDTYGSGWVYRFYDAETGEQLTLLLEGGELSYMNITLSVAGDVSPSLLNLEISARYADQD